MHLKLFINGLWHPADLTMYADINNCIICGITVVPYSDIIWRRAFFYRCTDLAWDSSETIALLQINSNFTFDAVREQRVGRARVNLLSVQPWWWEAQKSPM